MATSTSASASGPATNVTTSDSKDPQHQHQHQHQHQLEAANVAYFDALADDFDKRHPDAAVFADRLSLALRRVLVLDEDATSVLDYACGSGELTSPPPSLSLKRLRSPHTDTSFSFPHSQIGLGAGQVSRALAPYVGQLVGVDISPRMVEVYNTRANAQGLEPHEMRAVGSLDELAATAQQQQQQCFDIAVVRTNPPPALF